MSENIFSKLIKPSQRGRLWQLFFVYIVVFALTASVAGDVYINKATNWIENKTGINLPEIREVDYRLGLDLVGGTHLVYDADVSQIESKDRASAVEGARDVIERRVNAFGVSEPLVQVSPSSGGYRIIVELAGVSDVNEAIKMIGETPLLEFKEQDNEVRELTLEERAELETFNAGVEKKAEDVLGKVISNGDFAELAKEFSDDTATKENGGDMGFVLVKDNPQFVSYVENLNVGETTELIDTGGSLEILKLTEKQDKKDPFNDNETEKEVKASHLLICHNEVEGCEDGLTKDEAYQKIKELKEKATPNNFAQLVKDNSTEPGASDREGDLGWFGRGMMVAPFEDTVFQQEVGTISWVVETQFGYHLIYKQNERPIVEYRISRIAFAKKTEANFVDPNVNWKNSELTGKHLDRAQLTYDPNTGVPQVSLQFDDEGAKLFADITERNIGKPVAIFLDGTPISIPTVNEKIPNGQAVINGSFNFQEAKELAQRLNAGALPVPIDLVNQQTVGPSLGHKSLTESLKAGLIGLLLVVIFMIMFYRLPGVVAILSLLIYGSIILFLFKFWVTLSLAGMAGFVLSIGMAVDANVLIFERLREELKQGNPMDIALEEAFKKAWPSIRDGNFSTIITCLILIWFTTSVVKGFAITLLVGIIVSMFSALFVTKNFIMLASIERIQNNKWLYGVKK